MRKAWSLACLLAACSSPAPKSGVTSPVPASPPLADQVVKTAHAFLPEEDSGRSEPADAADFVRRAYAENGIEVPKTVEELSMVGVRVAPSELRAGDILIFSGERISRIAEHTGVYAGKGVFLHYRPGYGVTLERLDAPYHKPRLITARRLIY